MTAVLDVRELSVRYPGRRNVFGRSTDWRVVVDRVSFALAPGQTLALIGESGAGKTSVALSVLGLMSRTSGQVIFGGQDLLRLSRREMRPLRRKLQGIFQDTLESLDPEFSVEQAVTEGLHALGIGSRTERHERTCEALSRVGLDPVCVLHLRARTLSGGQRQRVAIARAIVMGPAVIVCDEPTSSLDPSVQAQVVNLLLRLQREDGVAYLFITHNVWLASILAHRVAVMHSGRIVEEGATEKVLQSPTHQYTKQLVAAASVTAGIRMPRIEVP